MRSQIKVTERANVVHHIACDVTPVAHEMFIHQLVGSSSWWFQCQWMKSVAPETSLRLILLPVVFPANHFLLSVPSNCSQQSLGMLIFPKLPLVARWSWLCLKACVTGHNQISPRWCCSYVMITILVQDQRCNWPITLAKQLALAKKLTNMTNINLANSKSNLMKYLLYSIN